jgi:hypothetical protein
MKKLDSIIVKKEQILLYSVDNALKGNGEFHILDSLISKVTIPAEIALAIPKSIARGDTYFLKRAGIQFVCDNSPDFLIIQEAFLYISPYPEAQKMLWHYLTGNGEEIEVDTARIYLEDWKIRETVNKKLKIELNSKKTQGKINIQQWDYDIQNWRNAFGAVDIHYKVYDRYVHIWIVNEYKWTPGEARISQCVHQALDRARKYGARNFNFKGTTLRIEKARITGFQDWKF